MVVDVVHKPESCGIDFDVRLAELQQTIREKGEILRNPYDEIARLRREAVDAKAENELLTAAIEAASDWQHIETAPKDGTSIQAMIPKNGSDNIIAWDDGEYGHWFFVTDQKPPDCWTDGICWGKNDDDKPSAKPTHWNRHKTKPVQECE